MLRWLQPTLISHKNNTTCHKLFTTGLICLLKNDTRCPYFQIVYILFWVTVRCGKKSSFKTLLPWVSPLRHHTSLPCHTGVGCWGYLQPESLTEIRLTFIYDTGSDYQSGKETLVAAGMKMLHNFSWKVTFLFEEDEGWLFWICAAKMQQLTAAWHLY